MEREKREQKRGTRERRERERGESKELEVQGLRDGKNQNDMGRGRNEGRVDQVTG